ncbi:DUF4199 domain-containing protein [Pleomorphovibrio marinus]|uniref:DUF4199 domain-containing protein n=1 Tax=Pleomorphovibrio marinus TaxID=2164132 RepID=UPI000E0BFB0E|nr:DUF4199 domain-containing protein [Pleomorphovibrio marinus]
MESTSQPAQSALRSGGMMGLIMVIINFLIYAFDSSALVGFWFAFFVLVLFFGLLIYFGIQYRKEVGGYLTYGAAFQFSFVALIVAGLIYTIGNILLYHVIDPALPEVLIEKQLSSVLEMMDKFGAGDSLSADDLDEMRESMVGSYTIVGQIKGLGVSFIFYALMALIVAAILKKRDKSLNY